MDKQEQLERYRSAHARNRRRLYGICLSLGCGSLFWLAALIVGNGDSAEPPALRSLVAAGMLLMLAGIPIAISSESERPADSGH